MILNIYRTASQASKYFGELQYPKSRMLAYSVVSIAIGIVLSNSPRASDLPVLTLTAVLFGFTINAVVLLGNSSEQYLKSDSKHSNELEKYYRKSLYISVHTLGIGLLTIIFVGLYQLFPSLDLHIAQIEFQTFTVDVELVSAIAYTFTVYYLIVFSTVIASATELVQFRL